MSYGSFALDPIEPRVSAIPPAAFTVSAGIHAEVRNRPHTAPQPSRSATRAVVSSPAALPLLSPASLRAKGVTGFMEARRSDLLRAERLVGESAAVAVRSVTRVWPVERPAAPARVPHPHDPAPTHGDAARDAAADDAAPDRPRLADETALDRPAGDRSAPPSPASPPTVAGGRAALAAAALDVRRLAGDLAALRRELRQELAASVAEVNERAAQVAETNERVTAAAGGSAGAPAAHQRRREELVLTLGRLAGATAQPGAGNSLTVLIDGLHLVTGPKTAPLAVADGGNGVSVLSGDGRVLALTAGVLGGRLVTLNAVLPPLEAAIRGVQACLGEQAVDPAGAPVPGGAQAAADLGRLVAALGEAAESSSAYARVAAEIEVGTGAVTAATVAAGPTPPAGSRTARPSVDQADRPVPAMPSPGDRLRALQAALATLEAAAGPMAAPGGAAPTTAVVSGAPGMATPIVAPGAPAGLAVLRVISLATGAIVGTAQAFRADTPLGEGRDSTVGIITAAGTAEETTVMVDVGRYPTPADLASLINLSNAGVHASLAELTGGTVQLRLESLATGRGQEITIIDGTVPPAASTVLGRLVTISAPRDTVVEVQQAGRAAALAHGTGRVLRDVLPGVDAQLHMADPSRVFEIGVRVDARAAVDGVARLTGAAADVVGAARAAGADGLAARVLTTMGLPATGSAAPDLSRPDPSRPDPSRPGPSRPDPSRPDPSRPDPSRPDPSRPGPRVPGLHLDNAGNPTVFADQLAAAYEAAPERTAQAVTAFAQRLSAVGREVDPTAWVVPPRPPVPSHETYTRPTRHGDDPRPTLDLTRQEHALLGVLARLQDQADWLSSHANATGP